MSADGEDRVGKGRPPKWTQFQKGKSGNPKGRPRKAKAPEAPTDSNSRSDDILREVLAREVTIRDSKGERRISSHEAVRQAQLKSALAGSPIAQRDVMREAQELEARDAMRKLVAEEVARQRYENVLVWRKRQARLWEEAVKEDREPDEPWPHPDDFIIDEKTRQYRIRGPINEDDLSRFDYYRAERDATFITHIIKLKVSQVGNRGLPKFWAILWLSWDVVLPLRWQNHQRYHELGLFYLCQPLRKLRKMEALLKVEAAELKSRADLPVNDKDVYREVNAIMKPLVKRLGFRSLAEFERAYEEGLVE
jgi:hypothetical protein